MTRCTLLYASGILGALALALPFRAKTPFPQMIDTEVKPVWKREKITPAGRADDAAFVWAKPSGPRAPVLRRTDGAVELLDSHTLPLGVTSEPPGEEVTVRRLAPGDTLLMFSDGVTETRNPEGHQWNTDGPLQGLARHGGVCGSDLLRAIDQENLVFAGGESPGDDRSVVVATFRGK
jgi:hypothetical protein